MSNGKQNHSQLRITVSDHTSWFCTVPASARCPGKLLTAPPFSLRSIPVWMISYIVILPECIFMGSRAQNKQTITYMKTMVLLLT